MARGEDKGGPRAALGRLIEGVDVVVHDMRLGAADRFGLEMAEIVD
jgi:crotonobetainyl-CoA:carnitine CoA-transferase CaiB-like acyl-CoA transferase